MKNKFLTTLIAALMIIPCVQAEAKIDSVSIDPGYVQAGYDVDVKVKISEGLVARKIYATQWVNGSKIPIQDKSVRYKGALLPKDGYTKNQAIIKQDNQYVGYLNPGESWTVPFDVKIKSDTDPVNLTFEFKVLRADIDDEVEVSREIVIPVEGKIKFSLVADNKLEYGTNDVKIYITNQGGDVARQVSVKLKNTGPITVTGSDTMYLGDLSRTQARAPFTVYVETGAELGAYMMPVTVSYLDRDGAEKTENFNIGLQVDAEPRVQVTAETAEKIASGKEGEVEINVINNGFVDVEFVNLELLDTEQYTVTGNRQVYIGSLESDDTDSEEFTIKVSESVDDETLTLKAKVAYNKEKSGSDYEVEYQPRVNLASKSELDAENGGIDGGQRMTTILLAVPALIIGYLAVWFVFKLVGLTTSYLNRKLFQRRD